MNKHTAWRTSILAGATILGLSGFAAPTQAQNKDATRSYDLSQPGSHNLRNFSVRNESGETVEWAEVRLTDGSTRTVTNGSPLTDNHSESVGAPDKACVSEVHVRFSGGRTLDSTGLSDCRMATVVVDRDRIELRSSARPGP